MSLHKHFKRLSGTPGKINYWYSKVTALMGQIGIFHAIFSGIPEPPARQFPIAPWERHPLPAISHDHSVSHSGPPSISIYGSCVSRDVFAIAQDDRFEIRSYIARQSILSAVAPPIPQGAIPLQNPSAFRLRAVECDLRKSAFAELRESKSDYLMIDLIDERFPLLPFSGSYITASNEFYESAPKSYSSAGTVKKHLKNGELYLGSLCIEDGIQAFCSRLGEIYRPEQVILHCAEFVDQYRSKSGEIERFTSHYLAENHRLNAILEAMFDRIQTYLPGVHVIRELGAPLSAEPHRWGLTPMHYEQSYYRRVLSRLYEIADLPENEG